MTIRFIPPRRLAQPAASAPPITRETEAIKRKLISQSALAQHRRRGHRRGAR